MVRYLAFVCGLVCGLVCGSVSDGWAQDGASIRGTVVDPLGARVPGAAVKLIAGERVIGETTTSGDGGFTFGGLAAGRYRIEASVDGFQTRRTDPLFVGGSEPVTVDVALPLSPLGESVSVTAAANPVLPSQVGAPVTVLDARTLEMLAKADVLEALRLVPGVSLVQTGQRGGVASVFVRGGNANFNKLLIDGIPANDIGGGVDLAQYADVGVDRVEALRDPNSVVFGSDALSGVVSLATPRGGTRVPDVTATVDGGNFATSRQTLSVGGAVQRLDYFSEFGHFDTDNELPNNAYRNTTYAGRFGVALDRRTDVSGTIRWLDRRYESPSALALYGTPDDAYQASETLLYGVTAQTAISNRWQATLRFGGIDQRSNAVNPTISGEIIDGLGFGRVMTLTSATGRSVTGRAVLDYGPYASENRATRRGIYAQTTYQLSRMFSLSGGGNYEREQGYPSTNIDVAPTTTRNNQAAWIEGRGTFVDRIGVTAGFGYAHNQVFKSAYTPRLSVVASLRRARAGSRTGDTRLTFNAGNGIKAPTIFQAGNSLLKLLQQTDTGRELAARYGVADVGPERGRNVDVGVEQGLWSGRVLVRAAYFDNAFYDLVEAVSRNLLPQLGIPPEVAAQVPSAYVNAQSFDAKGLEASVDAQLGRVTLAASYTHAVMRISESLSSGALNPSFNPAFPGIPIGNFSPLVGQRPFRRPPNTGSLLFAYRQGPATVALSGYFAGRANDSTFLGGSDENFGNSLLLPNEDLNPGYAKVDVSGSYLFTRALKVYVSIENLLDRDYTPSFGFPALGLSARAGVTLHVGGR